MVLTSDGEGNGPVRRIARGGGESALLVGGCVVGGEAKELGGWPWNGEAGFLQTVTNGLQTPWHGCKRISQSRHSRTPSFPLAIPHHCPSLTQILRTCPPLPRRHEITELIIITEANSYSPDNYLHDNKLNRGNPSNLCSPYNSSALPYIAPEFGGAFAHLDFGCPDSSIHTTIRSLLREV